MEQDIPDSAQIRVYLLGPLEIFIRDQSGSWTLVPKEKWHYHRLAQSLFKRLLVQPGRRLSRGALVDDVWAESPETSDATIYSAVSTLRSVIGKAHVTLHESSDEVAGQELVWTDIDQAAAQLKEAEDQGPTSKSSLILLQQALVLLERGELLEGETGLWGHRFRKRSEDMLKQTRQWLSQVYENQGKFWQASEQRRLLALAEVANEEREQAPVAIDSVRRGLAQSIGLAAVGFPLDVVGDRLLMALTHRSPDRAAADYLQRRADHYWSEWQTRRGESTLVSYVLEDVQKIAGHLEGSCMADTRTALQLVAANMTMLLGELFYEHKQHITARKYYKLAAIAAREANERSLEAVVNGRRCLAWIYEDKLEQALLCAQQGKQLAKGDKQIAIWLTAMEAEVHARMGNEESCTAALRHATRTYNFTDRYTFHYANFDPSQLAGYEGICYLKLQKPAESHDAMTRALEILGDTLPRRKPRLLIDLAESYILQKDPEAACETAQIAISCLRGISTPLMLQRLIEMHARLQPWGALNMVRDMEQNLNNLLQLKAEQTRLL